MIYEIYITEKSYGIITVEADNVREAKEKAHLAYLDGDTSWGKVEEFYSFAGKKV